LSSVRLLRFGLCVVAGLLWFATAPASANHIPGATYTGAAATGGTVELDVSADGSAVTRFVATGVPSPCGGTISKNLTGRLPIVNHAFSSDPADSIPFEGSFPVSGGAAGAVRQSSCPSPAVGWLAATAAVAAPPPPPDKTPPTLTIRVSHSQRLGRGGRIRVRVGCPDEPCRVVAGGGVAVEGRGRFRLKPASAQLAQGGNVRLEPKLGRRALEASRTALMNDRRVRVTLTVTASDGAGNQTASRLTIRPRLRG
jgi:hypothetical protein